MCVLTERLLANWQLFARGLMQMCCERQRNSGVTLKNGNSDHDVCVCMCTFDFPQVIRKYLILKWTNIVRDDDEIK